MAVTCATGLVGRPPAYVATVDVLITASVPERNQSLVHLVRSAAVERAVQAELGRDWPAPSASLPHRLSDGIKGHLVPRSNTIVITVRAPTPAAAERLAAAWGRVYERQMNRLGAPPGGGEAMPLVTLVSGEALAAPEPVPYAAVVLAAPAGGLVAATLLVLAEYAAAAWRAAPPAAGRRG